LAPLLFLTLDELPFPTGNFHLIFQSALTRLDDGKLFSSELSRDLLSSLELSSDLLP
jgi:hypothetical protein